MAARSEAPRRRTAAGLTRRRCAVRFFAVAPASLRCRAGTGGAFEPRDRTGPDCGTGGAEQVTAWLWRMSASSPGIGIARSRARAADPGFSRWNAHRCFLPARKHTVPVDRSHAGIVTQRSRMTSYLSLFAGARDSVASAFDTSPGRWRRIAVVIVYMVLPATGGGACLSER